jgi:hypothetical protein
MTKAQPRPGEAGTGAVTAGSGQASGSAGPVTPARCGAVVDRVVPAYLACRLGARARAGGRDAWPAVVAIALGSFALVFSEVLGVCVGGFWVFGADAAITLARERGRNAPAPPPGAIDTAGNSA